MRNTFALNQNKQFKKLYYRGNSKHSNIAALFYYKNKQSFNRIGFTVSKKIGKAVKRNRARRLLYEAYRLNENIIKTGYDFCIVAKTDILNADFRLVEKTVRRMFEKAGLIEGSK